MNRRHFGPRLAWKFTLISALALAVSFFLYFLLYNYGLEWLMYSSTMSDFWERRTARAIEGFQSYVTGHQLTMEEAVLDTDWESENRAINLILEPEPENGVFSSPDVLPVTCADGVLYAHGFQSFSYYKSRGMAGSIVLSCVCFFSILLPYVMHLIRRINRLSHEMGILAGGDLTLPVLSPGSDELALLGQNMEEMRRSVIRQMDRENEAIVANSRLIASLSHDLRTPLTKLTGYLEILQMGEYRDEAERDRYLEQALQKANQMRVLSDEIFSHFRVQGETRHTEVEAIPGAMLLSQRIAEQCYDLQAEGYQADPPEIEGDYMLRVDVRDMQRIFDNLFSNLRKYADRLYPIVFEVQEQEDEIVITSENRIVPYHGKDSRESVWKMCAPCLDAITAGC